MEFSVVNRRGLRQEVHLEKPETVRLDAWYIGGVPLNYAELDSQTLSPENYWLEARFGSELVARQEFSVAEPGEYDRLIADLADEKIEGELSFFEHARQLTDAWLASWAELFAYLRVRQPRFIIVDAPAFDVGSKLLRSMPANLFEWVMLHVNRFVLDQVFYGGAVTLGLAGEHEQRGVRLTIHAPTKAADKDLPGYLRALVESVERDGFPVLLEWSAKGTEGQLDVAWA